MVQAIAHQKTKNIHNLKVRRFSDNFWPLSEDFQKLCKDYTNVVNIFWKFQKTFQKDPKILRLCTNTFKHSLRVNAISKKPSISYQVTIWKICHLSSQCSFVHFTSSVFSSKKRVLSNEKSLLTAVWKLEWSAVRYGWPADRANTRLSIIVHSTSSSWRTVSFFKIFMA